MKTHFISETVNGMKVAIYPMKQVQSVMLRLVIRAGSWNEPGKDWGKIHLLEHMTFNATEKFPDELSMELFKEENGIRSNAWTGNSNMGYWFEFPYSSFEEALELFKQAVFHPTLPERDLAREKKIIQQEYLDKWSNPYARYGRAVDKHIYGENHVYIRDGMGSPDYIKDLEIKDLEDVRETYFVPENMVLGISGNVKVDRVLTAVKEIVSEAYKGKPSKWDFAPITTTQKTLFHKEDVDQVLMSLRWLTPGRFDLSLKERMTYNTASYMLGGSARSRLFRVLRMKEGLVYRTGAKWGNFPTVGDFEVWCSTNPKDAKKALSLMRQTIENFVKEPLDKVEFGRSTKYLNMQTLMSYDSVSHIAEEMSNLMFWNGRVIPPEEFIAVSHEIKSKDITNMLKEMLKSEPILTVLTKGDIEL